MTDGTSGSSEFDVIVAGAGPAGSTCATILADQGRRVLLLEKARFPRFCIGESLMPETYWVFERIGMLEKLKASRFPRKYSVQFIGSSGRTSKPFYFQDTNPHESSVTWQVPRDEFDQMMLDNAVAHGVEARLGVHVDEVLFEKDRAVGVQAGDGETMRIAAPVVVDATGQAALLARKLDLREPDPRLRKAAVFTHFRGAQRDAGIDEGATVIIYMPDRSGWFWYIPLPDDRVSVGVVGDPETLFAGHKGDPQRVLDTKIAACPGIAERVAGAEQILPPHVLREFSYRTTQCAGPGWVLIGDALGFLDPIYSSGVFLALKSGEFAADAIDDGLTRGDLSGDQLGRFRAKYLAGLEAIRKLVYAFYTDGFSFGRFLQQYPDQRDNVVALLIGDVFRDEVYDIFGPLEAMCAAAAAERDPART